LESKYNNVKSNVSVWVESLSTKKERERGAQTDSYCIILVVSN